MKMKSLLLLFFVLAADAMAQVQLWPPGGQKPSPYSLQLAANRFVPSTKRYNMVWADQLYGLPAGKIEFVAKNYVGTQKIFNYQAADYRTFNSNFLILAYHLALGLNPQHNDD